MDLDLRRPYATVYGDGPIHKYEQDGKLFNQNGMWIKKNGTLVTPKEKIAAAHKELEEHNRLKKLEIDKQIRAFEEEQKRLEDEAGMIMYNEAAKNIGLLDQPVSFFRSTEKVKDALDVLNFEYDPDEGYSELRGHLEKIFDAAHKI